MKGEQGGALWSGLSQFLLTRFTTRAPDFRAMDTTTPDSVISAQLEASAARAALRDMKNQLVSLKRELEHERSLHNAHKSPLHKRARAAAGAPASTSSPTTADATPSTVSAASVSASAAVEEDRVTVPKTPGASEQQQLLQKGVETEKSE